MPSSGNDAPIIDQFTPFDVDWSSEESASYESTLEAINAVVAACAARVTTEQTRSAPDEQAIASWSAQRKAWYDRRRHLEPGDQEKLRRVRKECAEALAALRDS